MTHSFPLHPLLAKPADWESPFLTVNDEGSPLRFGIRDAFSYHGYDAPGGVVLGFRLLQRAFALLAPGKTPERRKLALHTAFPGFGLRDTMELVTRMVTDGRYSVDTAIDDERAQEGVAGRFYYCFAFEGRSVELAPIPGYPGPDFIRLGKASKLPGFSCADAGAWKAAKFELANTLLAAPADAVIRVL